MENVYQQMGYRDRKHYLDSLARETGADPYNVYALAKVLGESEDFDGLIAMIEDYI